MKNKLHYFDLQHQKQRKHSASEDRHIQSRLFLKYFPKYQKEFLLTNKNGAIKSKIKRAKIIQSFQTSKDLKKRSVWRVLLSNKMKSVKYLSNSAEPTKQIAEQLKFFSHLKRAKILIFTLGRSFFRLPDKNEEFYLLKALKNMRLVQSLKHLGISPLSKESKKYLSRLNAYQRLLDSLKSLSFFFDLRGASNDETSALIEESKNLLKNVTCLSLHRLDSPFHFEVFQRLGELCSKVSKLSFDISCQEMIDNRVSEVKTNYLQTLKAFQCLRILNLRVADVLTFIRDFALPPLIEALRLDLDESLSKEIMLKIDNNFTDCSEEELSKALAENSLLLRFYESFNGLDRLETLELGFNMESHQEAYKYQKYLFQLMLKRASSSPLKSLKINPNVGLAGSLEISAVQDPFLPQFIESCEIFAPTLETLLFGWHRAIYSHFDLSLSWNKFPKLSSVEIRANFCHSQGSNVYAIGPFLENFISLGESIVTIRLEAHIDCNAKSLLSVLKQMNQLKRTSKLKIELGIYLFDSKGIEESGMCIADAIDELKSGKKCYSNVKRVFLQLCVGSAVSAGFETFLELYQDRFDKWHY